jgi:hypothetical protein
VVVEVGGLGSSMMCRVLALWDFARDNRLNAKDHLGRDYLVSGIAVGRDIAVHRERPDVRGVYAVFCGELGKSSYASPPS